MMNSGGLSEPICAGANPLNGFKLAKTELSTHSQIAGCSSGLQLKESWVFKADWLYYPNR